MLLGWVDDNPFILAVGVLVCFYDVFYVVLLVNNKLAAGLEQNSDCNKKQD